MPVKDGMKETERTGIMEKSSLLNLTTQSMISEQIKDMIGYPRRFKGMPLETAAQEVLQIYEDYKSKPGQRHSRTTILEKGVGLGVAQCYLQNMTIKQITTWVFENKNISVSKSTVGRFCAVLHRLGIAPVVSRNKQRV